MALKDSKLGNSNLFDPLAYDCIVIGTGPSAEPVIFHLAKTNLKTLVIDRSDISKEYKSTNKVKKKYLMSLTPKQIFSDLQIHENKQSINLTCNAKLSCSNFTYIYSNVSGGLSNFWGGGLSYWPESEIKKTTSLPYKLIKKSYLNLSKRLNILNRNQFLQKSTFSRKFIDKHDEVMNNIFQASKFFISKKGLSNHSEHRDKYDQHLIWNSSHTIREYIKNSNNIEYASDTVVLSIKKGKEYNILNCKQNNQNKVFKSRAIFLCSGVLNSTYLAFSALNKPEANLRIKHSFAAIVPMLYFGFLPGFKEDNIELPDLSWTLLSKDLDISGYLIPSYFLSKKIKNFLKKYFLESFSKLIEKLFSSFAFLTIYTNSDLTKTYLKIKRIKNPGQKFNKFLLEIENYNPKILKKRYISRGLNKLGVLLKDNFFLIKLLTMHTKNGADIHYGCTMPDKNIISNSISTSSIGEINNTKNIYVCDASRMAFISSLPHTFTTMAIVEASMPMIIKKLT